MAIKIYCDFCEKEIDVESPSMKMGTLKIVSRGINLIQADPQQTEKVEVLQLCSECCQKALTVLKIKESK